MDDKNKGYRGGLYGAPDETDGFMPTLPDPKDDPLFAEREVMHRDGKLALLSLIFGAVGMLTVCIWKAAVLCGLLGIGCGIIAKKRCKEDADNKWKTWSTVGLVLSIMALCTVGVYLLMIKLGIVLDGSIGDYYSAVDQAVSQ